MPTPKKGPRLGGSATNQKHILSNLAGQLITHGAIKTTDAKAKLLRPMWKSSSLRPSAARSPIAAMC